MIGKQDILDRAKEWQLRPGVVEKDYVLGWVLAVPAVALLALVFTPPVLRETVRPSRDDDDSRTF